MPQSFRALAAALLVALASAGPASAQSESGQSFPLNPEIGPFFLCLAAAEQAQCKEVIELLNETREACEEFKQCKVECREAKSDDRAACAAAKAGCYAICNELRGRDRRQCRRQCRQEVKACRQDARAGKQVCRTQCRVDAPAACRNAGLGRLTEIFRTSTQCSVLVTSACADLYITGEQRQAGEREALADEG